MCWYEWVFSFEYARCDAYQVESIEGRWEAGTRFAAAAAAADDAAATALLLTRAKGEYSHGVSVQSRHDPVEPRRDPGPITRKPCNNESHRNYNRIVTANIVMTQRDPPRGLVSFDSA